jgi:hypothetical protein
LALRCGPLKRCSADNSCAAISHSLEYVTYERAKSMLEASERALRLQK